MNVALQRQLFVPWIRVAFAPQDSQVVVSEVPDPLQVPLKNSSPLQAATV